MVRVEEKQLVVRLLADVDAAVPGQPVAGAVTSLSIFRSQDPGAMPVSHVASLRIRVIISSIEA